MLHNLLRPNQRHAGLTSKKVAKDPAPDQLAAGSRPGRGAEGVSSPGPPRPLLQRDRAQSRPRAQWECSQLQELESLKSAEKLCRQLIYHLTPHAKWQRQAVTQHAQPCLKTALQRRIATDSLDLSGMPLPPRDIQRVAYHLQLNRDHLVSIDLSFTELTDNSLQFLLPFLAALPKLTNLALNGNRLTKLVLKDMMEMMKEPNVFPALSWIDLGNNTDICSMPQPLLVGLRRRCSLQGALPTIQEHSEGQTSDQETEQGEVSQSREQEQGEVSQSWEEKQGEVSQSREQEQGEVSQSWEDQGEVSQTQEEEQSEVNQSQEEDQGDVSQSQEEDQGDVSQYREEDQGDVSQSQEEDQGEVSQLQEEQQSEVSQSREEEQSDVSQSREEEQSEVSQSQEEEQGEVSQFQEEEQSEVSQSREEEQGKVSQSQEEQGKVSQSQEEQGEVSQSQEEEGKISQSEEEELAEVSQSQEEGQIMTQSHEANQGLISQAEQSNVTRSQGEEDSPWQVVQREADEQQYCQR
ncbi:putative uncharacterized protein DDB_G0271606 [Mobula hypostoma]|uniref:putative uncharacterized protein DDB_G0271606 n=1 Tax=Mobula hypostoma TaxID=723540 RepID=UPI002FC3DEA9